MFFSVRIWVIAQIPTGGTQGKQKKGKKKKVAELELNCKFLCVAEFKFDFFFCNQTKKTRAWAWMFFCHNFKIKMKLRKTRWREKDIPWGWTLFQLTSTLSSFLWSPSLPSQNNAKGSHSLCVSPYIQYFSTSMLQMKTLKPSFFIKLLTFENYVFSLQLLHELFASIPCWIKHYDSSKSKVYFQN